MHSLYTRQDESRVIFGETDVPASVEAFPTRELPEMPSWKCPLCSGWSQAGMRACPSCLVTRPLAAAANSPHIRMQETTDAPQAKAEIPAVSVCMPSINVPSLDYLRAAGISGAQMPTMSVGRLAPPDIPLGSARRYAHLVPRGMGRVLATAATAATAVVAVTSAAEAGGRAAEHTHSHEVREDTRRFNDLALQVLRFPS